MKRHMILLILMAAMVLLAVNCGEDECPVCPRENAAPTLYAIGSASVHRGFHRFEAYIEVYDINGTGDRVDSALVDGDHAYCCIRDIAHTVANDGRQIIANFGSTWCPTGVIMEYYPGQTTEIRLVTRGVSHRAQLHLLDRVDSMPRNVQATADQALDVVHVSWDAVADAEWYAVKMRSQAISGPVYVWDYYCLDSMSVDASLPFSYTGTLGVQVYVAAGTGPMPTNEGAASNISGALIAGTIYSVSDDVERDLVLNPPPLALPPRTESITPPSIAELLRRGRPPQEWLR